MNQSVSLHNRSNPGNFAQSEHTILLDKYRKALLQLSNIV